MPLSYCPAAATLKELQPTGETPGVGGHTILHAANITFLLKNS